MRKSFLQRVLGISPHIEILVRQIYWHSDFLIKYKNKRNAGRTSSNKISSTTVSLADFEKKLRQIGIKEGDLLIVHSSYNALKPLGVGPAEIINLLLKILGEDGTLAMPTIPDYSNIMKKGKQHIIKDVSDEIIKYDPQETPSGTGIITNIFLKYPGVVRSKHPLNTMAALGPLAEQMMKNNLNGYQPLPCGVNSSWKFCSDNHAKILALGVDLAHSLTMIHVAEDVNPERWPTDWYRERKCRITENGIESETVVRERHPKWAMYYAERTLYKDLIESGIMKSESVGEVGMELIDDSKKLIDFLHSKNKNLYPYYFVKRKRNGKN